MAYQGASGGSGSPAPPCCAPGGPALQLTLRLRLPPPARPPAPGGPSETVLLGLWGHFAEFLNNLAAHGNAFPKVQEALRAHRERSRQLLEVACAYHSAVIAAQEPRWPDPRWLDLWRCTAGCLSALQQLAGFDAGWVSIYRRLCQQWVPLAARLEWRLAREPGPELLIALVDCSRHLLSYAILHSEGLRRQARAGGGSSSSSNNNSRGQPLPAQLLQALATGAGGLMAAKRATSSNLLLLSAADAARGPQLAGAVFLSLHEVCQSLVWGIESGALVGSSGAGPAPIAAVAAAEACVRLAAAFPGWLAGTVQHGAPALHAMLTPSSGQLMTDLVSAALMIASVHMNVLVVNNLAATRELFAAVYTAAVSAAKLCHCWASLPAESPERAVLGGDWAPPCVILMKNTFLFAHHCCMRSPGLEHSARWVAQPALTL
jgi:hypothetical protein